MDKLKKILYATDYSESSEGAGRAVRFMAELTGAEIYVLHVVGELVKAHAKLVVPEHYDEVHHKVKLHAVDEMEQFCERMFGEMFYLTEVVVGKPFEEIMLRARQSDADMIVMGTHGHTGLSHVLVGSTAERVVRSSPIPVLTVRNEAEE
ncbi:MAG: universal stress protein [Desulfuromonas sp.]|nr:universal stress protein [Desulfuromonas sp.]